MKGWVACAAGLVIGVLATWCFFERASDRHVEQARGRERQSAQNASSEARSTDALETLRLRSLIAQEVRGALHEAQREAATLAAAASAPRSMAGSAAPAAPAAPAVPAPEASGPSAGFSPARTLVDDRLVAGVWRPADRDALRSSLGSLRHEERMQLVRDLVQAINAGKLQSDDAEYF